MAIPLLVGSIPVYYFYTYCMLVGQVLGGSLVDWLIDTEVEWCYIRRSVMVQMLYSNGMSRE